MPKTLRQSIGLWGEEQAVRFLKRRGYKIIERNFYGRCGEIDIIASAEAGGEGVYLSFIEVKTRNYGQGSAEYATCARKLRRLINTAKQYCFQSKIDIDDYIIKFEHISVYINKQQKNIKLAKYVVPVCI